MGAAWRKRIRVEQGAGSAVDFVFFDWRKREVNAVRSGRLLTRHIDRNQQDCDQNWRNEKVDHSEAQTVLRSGGFKGDVDVPCHFQPEGMLLAAVYPHEQRPTKGSAPDVCEDPGLQLAEESALRTMKCMGDRPNTHFLKSMFNK